jgi:hypothetical protein
MLSDQRKRKGYKRQTTRTWQQAGQGLLALPKPQTLIQKRLIETSGLLVDAAEDIAYQHSILCQASLPYRDPGADVRRWQRRQGEAVLEVEAGRALHPESGDFVDVRLPFGAASNGTRIFVA